MNLFGFTRASVQPDHALITPDTHVSSPLERWENASAVVHISPAIGAEFSQFLGKSVLNPPRSPLAAGNSLYVLGGKLQAARHPTVEAPMALPAKQLT